LHKFITILIFWLGLLLTPETLLSQVIEDTTVMDNAADVVDSVKSYIEESGVTVKNIGLNLDDADLDTSIIIERLPFTDTLSVLLKQKEYQYHPINKEQKVYTQNTKSSKPWLSENAIKNIFWFITVSFLLIVIVLYLLDGNFNIFKRSVKAVNTTNDADIFNQSIFELDYNTLIQQATEKGDYNIAIRLYYLKLLANLSNKKLIDYSKEKTNFEYQFQLITTVYYPDFVEASKYYEYAWYADITITKKQYDKVVQAYQIFEQKLN